MKFDFFTLGGSQFWEDIFFYQKWRIQRHFETRKYRLLDPWDIQRHQGSFDQCLKAFYKYVEIYELPRQKGPMIIMIHGLFDSKNIFKPLWREALKNGFEAAAVNYSSSQKTIFAHADQIETFLNNLVDISEVSFVTKGVGALILRLVLNKTDAPWMKKIKVSRIVEIAPPNQGSMLFFYLCKYKWANLIFGPILKNATPHQTSSLPDIPKNLEMAIIDCPLWFQKVLNILPFKYKEKLLTSNEAFSANAKEIISVKNFRINPLNNKTIVNKTLNFIKTGSLKKIKKL